MTEHIPIAEYHRRVKAQKPRTTHRAERTVPASECEQYPKHCYWCGERVLADAGIRETVRGLARTWCDAACKEEETG